MADIHETEQFAREIGDEFLLAMLRQFKFNRIFGLCAGLVLLVLWGALIWKHLL
jgi:hypothetical protein